MIIRSAAVILVAACASMTSPMTASTTIRKARLARVDLSAALPEDLTHPDGKTRWNLSPVVLKDRWIRSLSEENGSITLDEGRRLTYTDPLEEGAAARWLLPDRDGRSLRPGEKQTLDLSEAAPGPEEISGDVLRIETEVVGIGWLHLPSGPRETVLQRALILREPAGSRGFSPDRLVHRWIDPRAGVVAEVSGPASADGRDRLSIDAAWVLEEMLLGVGSLKIYADDVDGIPYTEIAYGWDRGNGTTVASLTPQSYTTIGQLLAASTWDFSGNNTGVERASTTTPMNSAETCNTTACGYSYLGAELDREDKNWEAPDPNNVDRINTVTQRQVDPNGNFLTIWLRAGAQHEGKVGSLGTGESRFCYVTDGTGTRNPAPLWRFTHQDALDPNVWYMQAGDPGWSGGPGSSCQQVLFNEVCGGGGTFSRLYAKSCTGHAGTQSGTIIKGGVVTLPSGHTFNALVVSNIADFCVWLGSTCTPGFSIDSVKTVNYLWQVPVVGTVVRLQSAQNVPDPNAFTTLAETDFKFGLFPPLSISVTGMSDTSVSLSWNPGLDTHRIAGYRIYWDTDSGGASSYAFDSVNNAGQVSSGGTTATVSGLTPGVTYYFTVTSRSVYTDPSSHIVTSYESALYPTQVSGDPSFVYPTEVQATTTSATCIPTVEVTNLTVDQGCTICWDPVSDPCLVGYRVLGAPSPQSPSNFSTVADTGLTTCWTGAPVPAFFLVVARGTGGTGP
jgi:hypothetical protein